ncbi:protein inhibidor of host bacterial RNA polymerase [Klebsiella phage vB_KpnP-VAC1]|uniref:Protein inhibidor of host bacterial RNA polymerase n=1 Tax=Klebsiella phage vB_KpnP-VAC1 TaxID=2864360 RepID=A0AAE7XHA6_9CAUD|nr:protein inhibidor of host bacterial RNA polymerase [Klebsiella phage vB_KpnP-VAC1]
MRLLPTPINNCTRCGSGALRRLKVEQREQKYLLTMEGNTESFEIPVFARSLEEAMLQAEHYEDAGFVVTRIRPEVKA